MLSTDEKRLWIFDRFSADSELPKWKWREKEEAKIVKAVSKNHGDWDKDEAEMMMEPQDSGVPNTKMMRSSIRISRMSDMEESDGSVIAKAWGPVPWYTRLANWLRRRKAEQARKRQEISVERFFESVKNSTEELKVVDERARGYEAALEQAHKNSQKALFEGLSDGLLATRSETQLLAMGLGKFITEENIVQFIKKCEKGLRLDWVANFTRVIPPEVAAKKHHADELFIFDNYVVLHYDPEGKSWAETNAEKAKRQDPILFGLIQGKRQLYFVGDWKDELCDLTLDQIADTLGKDAIQQVA